MRLLLFDEGSNLRAARASAEAPSGVGGALAWPIRLYKAETNERVGFAAASGRSPPASGDRGSA